MTDTPTTDFETNLAQLQQLLLKLEQETLPLEQAIATFKAGMTLIQNCHTTLKTAEQTIEQLTAAHQLETLELAHDEAK